MKYRHTRHNAGFDVIDLIRGAHSFGAPFYRYEGEVCVGKVGEKTVALIKPQTLMNASGVCVKKTMDALHLPITKILIVVDDIDLNIGRVRVRAKGSAGTHNGLKSIIRELGQEEFARVRVGVGRPEPGTDLISHVLGSYHEQDRKEAFAGYEKAAHAVETIVIQGVAAAQQKYN